MRLETRLFNRSHVAVRFRFRILGECIAFLGVFIGIIAHSIGQINHNAPVAMKQNCARTVITYPRERARVLYISWIPFNPPPSALSKGLWIPATDDAPLRHPDKMFSIPTP